MFLSLHVRGPPPAPTQWYFCYNGWFCTNRSLSPKVRCLHEDSLLVLCVLWVWTNVWWHASCSYSITDLKVLFAQPVFPSLPQQEEVEMWLVSLGLLLVTPSWSWLSLWLDKYFMSLCFSSSSWDAKRSLWLKNNSDVRTWASESWIIIHENQTVNSWFDLKESCKNISFLLCNLIFEWLAISSWILTTLRE